MRVILDGLPLQVRSAGIAVYTAELVGALAALRPDVEFALFGAAAPRGLGIRAPDRAALPANVRWITSPLYPLIMGAPLMRLPRLLPLETAVRGGDVFHATNYALPRTRATALVGTFHDLTLLRHPELGTAALRCLVGRAAGAAATARRLIADSHATARDVRELLRVPEEKIRVIYPGCASCFRPVPASPAREAALQRYGLTPPYLLHLGTLEPRKNLLTLVRAYHRLRADGTPPPLVLAGNRGWNDAPLFRLLDDLDLRAAVRFTGPVAAGDLPALYSAAELFVYPSRYEGFGLPVVEAMACGTPVVTSNAASLPEVAGDAAVLVDPRDDTALAAAMDELLRDAGRRDALRSLGIARARRFTWERCARETLAVYEEALGAR